MIISGEPLLSPGLLLRALAAQPEAVLSSERQGSLSRRFGGQLQLFAYGRQALAAALRNFGQGRILVPAYICDTIVHGVMAAGWHWRYYPLGKGLAPDWDWLERHVDSADSAFLLVHYFGFPSDLRAATRFTETHRLSLIEDCAHAFLTAIVSPAVGRTGHATIYSWRKFWPVVNGGMLALAGGSNGHIGGVLLGGSGSAGTTGAARELGKWLMFKAGNRHVLPRIGSALSDERDLTPEDAARVPRPDRFSTRILAAEAANLDHVAQRRRENYQRLYDSVVDLRAASPLTQPLSEGVVPWCLPFTTTDPAAGSSLVEYLLQRGIGAWSWPDLPADVNIDAFPREARLAGRTVCLPVHQSLDQRHMRYIGQALRKWNPAMP